MIFEGELEKRIAHGLEPSNLKCRIRSACARSQQNRDNVSDDEKDSAVIAVKAAYRQHDAFSLSPVSVAVAVTVVTRCETDPEGTLHEEIVERISERLSEWHSNPKLMTEELSVDGFFAGELRMTGGSGRELDKGYQAWTDTFTFTVRGSERHGRNDQIDQNEKT